MNLSCSHPCDPRENATSVRGKLYLKTTYWRLSLQKKNLSHDLKVVIARSVSDVEIQSFYGFLDRDTLFEGSQ